MNHEPGTIASLLVLRGGALGDLLLTLPALLALRIKFPEASIVLLGTFPQATLARPQFVDETHDLNGPAFISLFGDVNHLEPLRPCLEGFDLAISFLSDPERRIEQNLLTLGAKKFLAGPHLLTADQHAGRQLFAPMEEIGAVWKERAPLLEVAPVAESVSGRIALHIGSGSAAKNWPIDHWSRLLVRLESAVSEIFLVAGESDLGRLDHLRRSFSSPKIRVLRNLPLLDLARNLASCEVFIGHDSGVSHLAAAVGVPTISLFGATDPAVWSPMGNRVITLRSPDHQMDSISVESVLARIFHTLVGS
jgi:heptosyltransferase III